MKTLIISSVLFLLSSNFLFSQDEEVMSAELIFYNYSVSRTITIQVYIFYSTKRMVLLK
jgi:hypothetical protein